MVDIPRGDLSFPGFDFVLEGMVINSKDIGSNDGFEICPR
jgi:hypothetical protein